MSRTPHGETTGIIMWMAFDFPREAADPMMRFDDFKHAAGYDLVGVTDMAVYDGLPAGEHPRSLFPEAASVVVLGRRIRRGEFRAMEEGSLWRTPGRWLTQFDQVVRFIESQGCECLPFAPASGAKMPRGPIREGQLAPNAVRLSVDYAAAAAGLGDIGYHGMFMSPEYGVRQRLGLLITDMPIEPGPGHTDPVCDRCMACVTHCPLGAIDGTDTVAIPCNGRTMTVGRINPQACAACPNGVSGDATWFAGAEELHLDIQNNQIKGDKQKPYARAGLPNRLAAPCARACIAHVEENRDTGYHIPFRIREPWGFRPDQARED